MSYLRGLSGFIVGAGIGGAGLVAVMAVTPEDAIPSPNVDVAVVDTTVNEGANVPEVTAQPEVEIMTPAVKEEKPVETASVAEEPEAITPTPKAEDGVKKAVKEPTVKTKPKKVKLPVIDADTPKKETGVTVGKKPKSSLPTIEAKVESPKPKVKKPEVAVEKETEPKDVIKGKALQQNAIDFAGSERPKLAIILRDVGDKGLSVSQLKSLNAPITIAISSDAPDATTRAQEFKAAGFEVIAMTSSDRNSALNLATNPGQVEKALDAIFVNVPNAIGLVDNAAANLQKNSRTAGVVIENFKKLATA